MKNLNKACSLAIAALGLSCSFNANANLLNYGDFEPGVLTGAYIPTTAGVWGLEGSQYIVGPTAGVTPFDTQMLQMGYTGGGAAQSTQIVSGSFSAGSTVTFEALFNGYGAGTLAGMSFVGRDSVTGADIGSTFFSVPSYTTLDDDRSTWESLSLTGVLDVDVNAIRVELFYATSSLSGGRLGFVDNASLTVTPAAVPVPAAAWLFGSGLLGLVGIARRKQD